jgi:hypothetical protein
MVLLRFLSGADPAAVSQAATPKGPQQNDYASSSEKTNVQAIDDDFRNRAEIGNARGMNTPTFVVKAAKNMRPTTPVLSTSTLGAEIFDTSHNARIPKAPSLKHPVFEVFEKLFVTRLLPDDYAGYEDMITSLVRRGSKEPFVRKQYHAALEVFLQEHRQAVSLHNKFARMYNNRFEGKHERFHLPVYKELESPEEKEKISDTEGKLQVSYEPQGMNSVASRDSNIKSGAVLSLQMYGEIDSERGSSAPRTRVNDSENHDVGASVQGNTVVELQEASWTRDTCTGGQLVDVVGSALPAVDSTADEASKPMSHPKEQVEVMQGAAEGGIIQAHGGALREDVLRIGDVRKEECSPTLPWLTTEPVVDITISPRPHFPQKQSVQSYLAWLHHRRTRYPTVVPNSSECVLIAKKLDRLPAHVYDEILYHWGFETSSVWGDWYKQNRLNVLGEDPRFDEEKIGWWQAWLKEGRDLKKNKAYR